MQDAQNGIMDASVTMADGKLSCSFTKAAVTELVIPDHDNVVIDLRYTFKQRMSGISAS